MKKDITPAAAVASGVEEAWRDVGASFERFCLTAGIATLADMMERVAKFHEARVEVFTNRLGSLIEPIVILIMGGIVLVLALAMFLPILTLTTSVR